MIYLSGKSDNTKRKVINQNQTSDITKQFDNGQSKTLGLNESTFKNSLATRMKVEYLFFACFVTHFFYNHYLAYILFIILYISIYVHSQHDFKGLNEVFRRMF